VTDSFVNVFRTVLELFPGLPGEIGPANISKTTRNWFQSYLGILTCSILCYYAQKMMWLVEIIRQEDNAVMIPDIFPLLHRGY
jgi:hypothetical protein